MERGHFLMTSRAGAATLVRSSALASPNDTVRVTCVDVHGRARARSGPAPKCPEMEIAAICDVDESALEQRLNDAEKLTNNRPVGLTDLRRLLEDKSIDAISIATPNHNHPLHGIWGCRAGKNVYVEKHACPSHLPGPAVFAAAQKYGRMVQHGTHGCSSAVMQEAVQKVREGVIGDVCRVASAISARHHRPDPGRTRARRRALSPAAVSEASRTWWAISFTVRKVT